MILSSSGGFCSFVKPGVLSTSSWVITLVPKSKHQGAQQAIDGIPAIIGKHNEMS